MYSQTMLYVDTAARLSLSLDMILDIEKSNINIQKPNEYIIVLIKMLLHVFFANEKLIVTSTALKCDLMDDTMS